MNSAVQEQIIIFMDVSLQQYHCLSEMSKQLTAPETRALLMQLAAERKMFYNELKGISLSLGYQIEISSNKDLSLNSLTLFSSKISLINCIQEEDKAIKIYEKQLKTILPHQLHFSIIARQLRFMKEALIQLNLLNQSYSAFETIN